MRLFRNREVRREAALHLLLTALFAAAGFFFSPGAGLLLLLAGIVFSSLHALFLVRRYRAIARLSEELDEILHGKEKIFIASCEEGELSILQSEISKMTRRLGEQAAALAAEKGRLSDAIADIFHQIRTPLTSIRLSLSLLSEGETPEEERRRLLRDVKRDLERIRFLTESLLTLAKIDAGRLVFRPEEIPLRELLEKAASPHRIAMELRGEEFLLEAGEEKILCDPNWTAEAISNLIRNAAEHTPPGGRIRVTGEDSPLFAAITVKDDGPGFSDRELPHLFERFFKGENASPGSVGIGLALCREIVMAQGGTVTAENAPGGGACFTVKLYKSVV